MSDKTITAPEGLLDGQTEILHRLTRVHPGPAEAYTLAKKMVIGREPPRGITIEDKEASRQHAQLSFVSKMGVYRLEDLQSKNGTYLFGRKVTEPTFLQPGAVIRIGGTFFVYSVMELVPELMTLQAPASMSIVRAHAEQLADRAAPTDLPVLITGPTGAGKELIAKRIHEQSRRPGKLVAVNCATFGKDLVASELFGHKEGAFSGATSDRAGLFVTTAGGTLFLDEIAELPLDQQPALLRALQEKRVRPVGADEDLVVDVRVVAATHQNIESLIAAGAFREDLYARLCGVTIELAGLADRREEILSLFDEFLGEHPPLTVGAIEALLTYGWPRNVRELQHAAENVRLFAPEDRIESRMLPKAVTSSRSAEPAEEERPTREALEQALSEHGGNVAQAARSLGHHRQALYRWMRVYGLNPKDFRP